jgi:hypothetical protein
LLTFFFARVLQCFLRAVEDRTHLRLPAMVGREVPFLGVGMSDGNQNGDDRAHRGRVQAQGGGTEESESWAESRPPTVTQVLAFVDLLEGKLKPKERKDRTQPLVDVRRRIQNAGRAGGLWAHPRPHRKSFYKRGSADIRVDLDVLKGRACVPDDYSGI